MLLVVVVLGMNMNCKNELSMILGKPEVRVSIAFGINAAGHSKAAIGRYSTNPKVPDVHAVEKLTLWMLLTPASPAANAQRRKAPAGYELPKASMKVAALEPVPPELV